MRSLSIKKTLRPEFEAFAMMLQDMQDAAINAAIEAALQESDKHYKSKASESIEWLSPIEAMRELGCGNGKLTNLRREGKIEYRRPGKEYQYLKSSLKSYSNLPQRKK